MHWTKEMVANECVSVCVFLIVRAFAWKQRKKREPDDERWFISDIVQANWQF